MENENDQKQKEQPLDLNVRELQDEARKRPGYADDPHIESSNRSPKNEGAEDQTESDDKKIGGGE